MRNTFKSTVLAATVLTGLMAISPGAKANIFAPGDFVVDINYNGGSGLEAYSVSSNGQISRLFGISLPSLISAMASTSTEIIYNSESYGSGVYAMNQSGVSTQIATVTGTVSGIQTDANNNIFVSSYSSGYGINPTELSSTGAVLSTKSFSMPSAGNVTTGPGTFATLSSNESTLYVHNNGNVYGINTSTGAATELYAYSPSQGSPMVVLPNGNLLFSNSANEIQLNPNTGTVVSSTALLNGADSGLAVDTSNSFVYGANESSTMITYAPVSNLSSVSTFNTVNAVTYGATVFGQYTLDSQTPAPEPASAVLLVGMLGMLAAAKYRRGKFPSAT